MGQGADQNTLNGTSTHAAGRACTVGHSWCLRTHNRRLRSNWGSEAGDQAVTTSFWGYWVSFGDFSRAGGSRRRFAALGVVLAGLIVGALALVTSAGASSSAPKLVQVARADVIPAGAQALAAPAPSSAQTGDVALKPRDPAALSQFLANVTNRTSSGYHKYLAGGQFAAKFGPTQATIDAVKSQLSSDGLTVTGVASDGMLVHFSGTTAKVESAFSTQLARYTTAAGVTGEATTSAVKLPSTIASDVSGVIGLDTLIKPTTSAIRPPASAYAGRAAAKTAKITDYPNGAPQPCAAATAAANQYGGLTDDQVANAYGAFGLYQAGDTGAGVNVAIYEQEPFDPADLQLFDQCYFGANQAPGGLTIHNVDETSNQTGTGEGEAILDVEDVSAMAPGAHIDVYDAPPSLEAGIDEYAQMVDQDTDKIISSSYGFCEQDESLVQPGSLQTENYIFEQAAAQGQTVLNATGDTGSDACNEVRSVPAPTDQNPLSVGDPASQPYVLAVGGTTIQDADPAHYDETTWNDGAEWGGGNGGLSSEWAAPSWQLNAPNFPQPGSADYTNANDVETTAQSQGISDQNWAPGFCANNTTAGLGTSTPCRGTPDVSADSDEFTGGITITYAGAFITEGGTSSATPLWAGLLALVDASPACQTSGVTTADGIGFVSPLLYAVAANPTEYAASFHDITSGNNDVYGYDDGKTFPAGMGYDLATGLGSPILTNADGTPGLADDLCALAGNTSTAPSITALSPTAESTAGGTLKITGTGFNPTNIKAVSIGSDVISGSAVTGSAVTANVDGTETLTLTAPPAAKTLATGTSTQTDPTNGNEYTTGGSTGTQDGAGPADVVVTLTNGQSTRPSQFSYVDETSEAATPSVSSISPFAGAQAGGQTVTVYGSGFANGDTVTIGGINAPSQFVSSHELKVTAPAYSKTSGSATQCTTTTAIESETAKADPAGVGETDPNDDDICQTNVVVSNGTDVSATDTPLPVYEGAAPTTNQDGLAEVPTGYEETPTPTEFDYAPTPTIATVSTDTTKPATLADASGGTIVEITGTGLDLQTLDAVTDGDPTVYDSDDYSVLYATGTVLEVKLPADPNVPAGGTVGTSTDPVPIGVLTAAGQSAAGTNVTYAGIPAITAVSTGASDEGYAVGPDAGGTPLTITGQGFNQVLKPLEFNDNVSAAANGEAFSDATQYQFNVASDTEIDTQTLQANPAILDTSACSVSGCSTPSSADELIEYPPGDPVISSIDVSDGPAAGGTLVTLTGENLGCVTAVDFGTTPALTVANAPALLDCGSTTQVTVVAPPGTLGSSVPISLRTVESDHDAVTPASSPQDFTYTPNPTLSAASFGSVDLGSSQSQTVTVTNPGDGDLDLGAATVIGTNPGDFSIGSDSCSNATVATDESCTVQVTFTPATSGSRSATLDIPFNSSPTDLTTPLTGTGAIPSTTTTVTTPATTVTQTVTTPALTQTVTTPGTTVTVVTPPVTYTKVVICTVSVHYRYKTVTVKVKVHGKTVTKRERKKVSYTTKTCKTETVTKNRAEAIARAKAHAAAKAKAAATAKAQATPKVRKK